MAVDTARLLSEVSKSVSTIRQTLEKKILDGVKGNNPSNSDANAIKNLKKNIKINSGITGSSTKNVPDEIYTAFATIINKDLVGTKIKKLSTNDFERTNQIANALKAGIKNKKTTIPVHGIDYSIEYNIVAYGGVGNSSAHVRYKNNEGNQHIILTWTNVGTQQGTQALAEYCSLLTDLDKELWKDFFKKVLTAGAKTWSVGNYGTQILNSINDKNYAESFLKGLGVSTEQLSASKFGQFIKDNAVGGDVIVSSAKLLKTLEKKQTALVTAVNKNKKIESKLKEFAKTCNQLETKLGLKNSNFSIGEFTVLDIINKKKSILLAGTALNDTISNWGEKVTIKAGEGDDSINNQYYGENVKIFGENGNDNIFNFGYEATIFGGNGDDSIDNGQNCVTINGGKGNDFIENSGEEVIIYCEDDDDTVHSNKDKVTISGGKGNDSIVNNYGSEVTISGGNGNDYIYSYDCDDVTISGGSGNDSISTSYGRNAIIYGGKGNDYVYIPNNYVSVDTLIQYTKGDGNDTVVGFTYDDTLQITKGNYKVSTKNNDVIVKVGLGKIILKDAVGTEISIQDSKGKVTTKTYGYSSSDLLAENNFVTADNLSEIVKNNLSPTSLEKISENNFENLIAENNLITFSEK